MLSARLTVFGAFSLTFCMLSGCINQYAVRQASIDSAYQRGEISFVQREQMTHSLEQERQQQLQASMSYLGQMNASQPPPPRMISPQQPTYQLYDQYGNQIGTARPR